MVPHALSSEDQRWQPGEPVVTWSDVAWAAETAKPG